MLYFNTLEKNKDQTITTLNNAIMTHPNLQSKAKVYSKLTLRESMFDGHNLWVLKPNDLNRGRGVHLFNSLEQLKKLISEYTKGIE